MIQAVLVRAAWLVGSGSARLVNDGDTLPLSRCSARTSERACAKHRPLCTRTLMASKFHRSTAPVRQKKDICSARDGFTQWSRTSVGSCHFDDLQRHLAGKFNHVESNGGVAMGKLGRCIERESRSARWIKAVVRSSGGAEVAAVITNISGGGCRIRAAAPFEVGELIEIVMPRLGSISAYIRWSEAEHSGAQFVLGSDDWSGPARNEAAAHCGVRPEGSQRGAAYPSCA